MSTGRVVQVNVSKGGIPKKPVPEARFTFSRVEGDDWNNTKAHGLPGQAVCLYSAELIEELKAEGYPLFPGALGENLTTEGIDVNGALVGERWGIGTTVLEVSEPRVPCWRLGVRMNDKLFPRRFMEALRPGAYLRIVVEGDVGTGDEVRLIERPDHGLAIRDLLRIYAFDRQEAGRLLAAPRISEDWRWWAEHYLQEAKGGAEKTSTPGCQ